MAIVTDIGNETLDAFVKSQQHSPFLQSWDWGSFQKRTGNRPIRFGLEEGGKLVWAGSAIRKSIFGFNYLYLPRIGYNRCTIEARRSILRGLVDIAKSNGCAFVRFDPTSELGDETGGLDIRPTIPVQPPQTLVLDLRLPEKELLEAMRPKTRYNIRLAEKKGVTVRQAFPSDFPRFWAIMSDTEKRDGFRLHGRPYYEKMLAVSWIELFLAEYEGRVLAGNIVSLYGDTATYIHGASSNEDRHLMAPYALQWAAIKKACERGFKYYDFHGIDEKKWPGVTRFKLGFGGERVVYPGTFDLVVDRNRYAIYKILRKIRRLA